MADAAVHARRRIAKNKKPRAAEKTERGMGWLYAALSSALIGAAAGVVMLLLLCAILLALDNPTALVPTVPYLAYLPAALVAGVRCAKTSGLGGIPSGAVAGGMTVLLLFGLGVCIPSGTDVTSGGNPSDAIAVCVMLFLACVSGYVVTHTKPRVKRRFK